MLVDRFILFVMYLYEKYKERLKKHNVMQRYPYHENEEMFNIT